MWLNGDRASRTYIGWMGYSRRVAHMPKTEGKEPGALEAQILPSAVPSHSILRSSVKNLTSPFSATFSHPKKFCGNPQRPSVTRRDRSKLAPEVAARFLSFNSLLASVLASKSEVRSARAGATWRLTAARPARPRESARLVAFAFFVVGALAAALTYARIRDRCVRFVSQRARKLYTHSPARALAHSFLRRGHARRASTLASRRRDDRSFSLPLSLSPPSVVPSSPHASSSIAPPRLRSIHRPYLEVRPPRERDGRPNERDAFDRSGPPRTCTIFAWTVNMSLVKLVVTTTTTTTTHDDDDDARPTDGTIHRPIESRARTRRDSTPARGWGSRVGWGGVESSRDRSISPKAGTSRDHAREIRGPCGHIQ